MLERLTIKTKQAKTQKLDRNAPFAWAQREFVSEVERQYNAGEPVRIIVLKGRQLGISTVTEAILFLWCFLYPGCQSLVLSKEKGDSEYLMGMTKRYWETGPFRGMFETKYNREDYLEWHGLGSSIGVETAKKEDVGRGRTLQAVHCSECAFWPEADGIIGSLSEAIAYEHGTIQILESTAQGVGGYFHDEWMKAIDPAGDKSTFTPMFFPWWEHDEYSIPGTNLRYGDLDEDERTMLALYPQMTLAKLAWRRRKAMTYSNPDQLKEEYPNSMEEAFLSTGSNVFPLVKLAQCYDPNVDHEQGYLFNDNGKLEWVNDEGGHTFVYKRPDPRKQRRYVVAVDPTWTIDGDPCCIQVMDRANMEQVAVWHGSADPGAIGEISLALAYWYGATTILNTEVQGGGRKVMDVWREAQYPLIWYDRRPDRPKRMMQSLGFNSTYETKNLLLGNMQTILQRRQVLIHHPATYYEMTRYINNGDGTYGPSRRSGHDDCVISLGIALWTVVTESSTMDWAAMAAQGPAYIPGETPPWWMGQGRSVQVPGIGILTPMDSDDATVGIDLWY